MFSMIRSKVSEDKQNNSNIRTRSKLLKPIENSVIRKKICIKPQKYTELVISIPIDNDKIFENPDKLHPEYTMNIYDELAASKIFNCMVVFKKKCFEIWSDSNVWSM